MDYHTLLARLGEGSAHPGGFQATQELIGEINFPRGTKVLEAGCGTGRTACYLASLGCNVTAIDRNEDMIQKATHRAKISELPVRIVQADAASIPFPDETFDAVFTESVQTQQHSISDVGRGCSHSSTPCARRNSLGFLIPLGNPPINRKPRPNWTWLKLFI